MFFLFLCEHLWDPPDVNFVTFHCCHHHFQSTEADIQLCTQILGCNLAIHMRELIKALCILWCDSCAWLPRTWLVFHVAVATAETHHPPPQCVLIHCWVSINNQQASMNVSVYHFFHTEEFSDTPLLHLHFHVRCHFVRLPLCCHLSHGNDT